MYLNYLKHFIVRNNKQWKKIEKKGKIPLEKDTIKSIIVDVRLQNTGRNNIDSLFQEEENKKDNRETNNLTESGANVSPAL